MMESPIKWMGGKKRLAPEIVSLLPTDAECYVEVFAGALWVLFSKRPHPVEVVNDKNDALVNLWRVLKWRSAELLEVVHQSLYSRTMFYELREQDPTTLSELDRAAWLYLLIQQSFGSDLSSIRSSRFGYWNKAPRALFLSKSLAQFEPAMKRLSNVFIECGDFEEIIGRYDQPRSIFFCDPPYLGTCGYEETFGIEDHRRLVEALARIEGRFLLTVNDSLETRDLYGQNDWTIIDAFESRGISRATRGRLPAPILFVSNYRLQPSLFDSTAAEPEWNACEEAIV